MAQLSTFCILQWDLSIKDTLGPEKQFVIQRFPLFRAVCYREVFTIREFVIRGPTVYNCIHKILLFYVPTFSVLTTVALKRDKSLTVSILFRLVGKKMCSKWHVFGVHLGVERSLMDTVQKDCGDEVKGCFLEVTERWLSGEDGTGDLPRTWEVVFDALKQTGFPLLVREVKEQLSEEQSFTEAEVDMSIHVVHFTSL